MWAVRPVCQQTVSACFLLQTQEPATCTGFCVCQPGLQRYACACVCACVCIFGRRNYDLKEKAVEESNSRVLASIKDKEMSQWLPPPGEEDTSTVQDLLNTLS